LRRGSLVDEAQRLRDLLRDRDNEIHRLETTVADHEADEGKVSPNTSGATQADHQYTRELHSLEADVKRLEQDLATARRAESVLETQKQENLQLKETIDRMRFDLDEARAAAANSGKSGHGRMGTSASSVGGTLSKNLGDEMIRKLSEVPVAEELEDEEDEGDSFVETVVTTQRTRVSLSQ